MFAEKTKRRLDWVVRFMTWCIVWIAVLVTLAGLGIVQVPDPVFIGCIAVPSVLGVVVLVAILRVSSRERSMR